MGVRVCVESDCVSARVCGCVLVRGVRRCGVCWSSARVCVRVWCACGCVPRPGVCVWCK